VSSPTEMPPRRVTPPAKPLPELACDTHAHVFGPYEIFPLAAERRYTPPLAPFEDYTAMLARAGFARGVVVHASANGYDCAGTLDALARGAGRLRGCANWRPVGRALPRPMLEVPGNFHDKGRAMIKFIIISRHKPGMTRERFFYEWAFIHVSLMLLTVPSMRRFKRYVQHYANPDIPNDCRVLPRSNMNWESYAEHWTEKLETTTPGPEYTEQMQPHSFSDSAMEIAYLEGETVYQRQDFRSGGVKLIHRLARRDGRPVAELRRQWRDQHVPLMVEHLAGRGLRKLAVNVPHEFNVADFRSDRAGTLFEKASIDPPLGVEEMWFDSLESALQMGRDPELREKLTGSYRDLIDIGKSYSMLVHERVVYDFVTPGEISPLPAVLNPDSLESQLFKSGRPYHEPKFSEGSQ
jgi:hypothetical protein